MKTEREACLGRAEEDSTEQLLIVNNKACRLHEGSGKCKQATSGTYNLERPHIKVIKQFSESEIYSTSIWHCNGIKLKKLIPVVQRGSHNGIFIRVPENKCEWSTKNGMETLHSTAMSCWMMMVSFCLAFLQLLLHACQEPQASFRCSALSLWRRACRPFFLTVV